MVPPLDGTTTDATTAAPAPTSFLECRLCGLSFDSAEEKREHAKSEWHVYRIRCRVAEPGTTISPPGSGPKRPTRRREQDWTSASNPPKSDEESYSGESESDTSSDQEIIEFAPEECLFCNQTSKDFDENLSHMRQTHGLFVPFESSLTVDIQTLIWFLHMLIFSYRECICCGKSRRTVEALQQHMASLGHCRFNMTEEMTEFYHMDALGQQPAEWRSHPDDRTLRLPSGKLLGHRSFPNSAAKSRLRERAPTGQSTLPTSQQHDARTQALSRRDQREQTLTAQVAQLRTADQMGLAHLPESQRRSLLVAQKKEVDEAKRAERRRRGQVDNVGNKAAIHTKYYKQEVPIYQGG